MFVLVRHAHAGNKHRWPGPDDDRPLSARGQAEALDIARLLVHVGVTGLLSSPTLRCRQTLEPVAAQLRIPVQDCAALTADASAENLLRLLDSPMVNGAALCTHGETLKTLSAAWTQTWGRDDATPPDLSGTPKGGCWVVEGYGTASAVARLVATPARS